MLRSEKMTLCQVFIPAEAAYFVVSELGEIGAVQFLDLNKEVTAFRRRFVDDVRRCHEMERKLRYIQSEIESHKLTISQCSEFTRILPPNEIAALETHISRSEEELKRLSQNAHSLKQCSSELVEFRHVLEKSETFLRKRDEIFGFDFSKNVEDLHASAVLNQFNFITGLINRDKVKSFETMLWRVTKGNVLFERFDIERPLQDVATDLNQYKTVFIVCFHGKILTSKINKICQAFHATVYNSPNSSREIKRILENISRRLDDIHLVITQTYSFRENFLMQVSKDFRYWSTMVSKIKAVYHVLNLLNMDTTGKSFIAQCWVPFGNIPAVNKALADGSRACGCPVFSFLYIVRTEEKPPTFNRTNKFTKCFQKLVDSYGVASYQEVNPALCSIVTFPFFFAVMFGDVGHALILIIFAASLIFNEERIVSRKINSDIFNIFFTGRYLVLLMGVFSLYTGLIYNEVFSKSVNLFGTSWYNTNSNRTVLVGDSELSFLPDRDYVGTPYLFGVDPIWGVSSNRIAFLNSYKMKMSIIFGVLHMILGLCSNIVNFVEYSKIFLEFLPRLMLLSCLFLYLITLMFLKWIIFSPNNPDPKFGISCAPSILITFINMLLLRQTLPRPGCSPDFFQFQPKLQKILLLLALSTIPVMLFGTPIHVMLSRRNHPQTKRGHKDFEDELSLKCYKSVDKDLNAKQKTESLSDLFILQVIHTIEYGLGTVSHTASYLRLWALSLAHSELSEVLWNRVLILGLKFPTYGGGVAVFFSFFVWAFFTVTILVVMEGLSAFLHTLRLHWVEFMSKFYAGNGYPFKPFSFKEILEHHEEKEADEDVEQSGEDFDEF